MQGLFTRKWAGIHVCDGLHVGCASWHEGRLCARVTWQLYQPKGSGQPFRSLHADV